MNDTLVLGGEVSGKKALEEEVERKFRKWPEEEEKEGMQAEGRPERA
jgi:hypothetical protein